MSYQVAKYLKIQNKSPVSV
ncbi:Protein of unknown function [Lactobacillus delbrueckii subsp. bulgaricus]|nr:Protein of unknown function [Lactobacillus delbrueckii subsp. bulgaricus]